MHYPFPIGVSTIGKVITPARGREMYIASTTGTSDTDRIQAMVKNAVYGIAAARADGLSDPSVGILNIDGARQAERHLLTMQEQGYQFRWGESQRADGGHILRGNDLLSGSVDVVVCDTLTGNILMKLFSAFTSGGNYETTGYGYGPGIGKKRAFDLNYFQSLGHTGGEGCPLLYCCHGAGQYKPNTERRDHKGQKSRLAGPVSQLPLQKKTVRSYRRQPR
jgi:hypothetical protein